MRTGGVPKRLNVGTRQHTVRYNIDMKGKNKLCVATMFRFSHPEQA
jgi:hypothetical protein